MPDTFFRIFLYGAATVALGAGVFVLADKFVSDDAANDLPAAAVVPVGNALSQGDPKSTPLMQPEWKSDIAVPAESFVTAGKISTSNPRSVRPQAHAGISASPARDAGSVQAPEPMIRFGGNAVELTVPVHPQSGQPAYVPIALALVADPTGVPEHVRQDAQRMAADFLDNVSAIAAAAGTAQDAAYYNRWTSAAFLSDRDFKMRYGRQAYVQMNQLAAQEAAAGLR